MTSEISEDNLSKESSPAVEHREAPRSNDVDQVLDFSSRVSAIRAHFIVDASGRPFVRLVVEGLNERRLMDSTQDLEDTLAVGGMIVETVSEVLAEVTKILKDNVWRENLGNQFTSHLAKTENATRQIRSLLDAESG